MSKKRLVIAVVAVFLLLAAIGSFLPSTGQPGTGGGAATQDPAGVPWADYASSVRERIDAASAAGDCDALQAEFDTADANNEATLARTGHNNADLMGYIDDRLRAAGCY